MALTVKPLDKVRDTVPVKEVTKASPDEMVRVNLQVEKETRVRWHTKALQEGISLKQLIEKAVEKYIKESK